MSDAPDEVIRRLRRLADRGSADAQHRLGCCYEDGASVSQDLVAAARWWRLAAAQGHAGALFDLGHLHAYASADGGVARDPAEAARLYGLAVEQGHSDAQYYLGRLFSEGDGVPQDFAEAVRLWRLAAAQGHPTAQYHLGLCAHHGTNGMALSLAEAARLYRLAATGGQASAQNNRAALCYAGYDGAPPDFAEATRLWGLAAAQAHDGARFHLAQMCALGDADARGVVCGLAAERDAPELAAGALSSPHSIVCAPAIEVARARWHPRPARPTARPTIACSASSSAAGPCSRWAPTFSCRRWRCGESPPRRPTCASTPWPARSSRAWASTGSSRRCDRKSRSPTRERGDDVEGDQ
jgi:TPR repeat protein